MALADAPGANNVDEDARKVLEALDKPEYDFRTVPGIARETKLDEETIRRVIEQHPDLIRLSSVPGPKGEELYTLSARRVTRREQVSFAQSVVGASTPWINGPKADE
jgi:hypothetical protein